MVWQGAVCRAEESVTVNPAENTSKRTNNVEKRGAEDEPSSDCNVGLSFLRVLLTIAELIITRVLMTNQISRYPHMGRVRHQGFGGPPREI